MLDFFDSLEKKKAFKKALQEVKNENQSKSNNTVSRVYGESSQTTRYNGPLSKPATDVVDLKHFKDWRKVEKVESNNPVYDSNLFGSSLKKADQENSTLKTEQTFKSTPVSNFVSKPENQDRKASSDFDDFFSKRNIGASEKVEQNKKQTFSDEEVSKAKNTFSRMFEDVEKKRKAKEETDKQLAKDKAMLSEILTEMEAKKSEQKLPEVKVEVEDEKQKQQESKANGTQNGVATVDIKNNVSNNSSKPETIKVKIRVNTDNNKAVVNQAVVPPVPSVNSSTAKPTTQLKKVVKRKPRGKNKRRFDADVIGSVDWR